MAIPSPKISEKKIAAKMGGEKATTTKRQMEYQLLNIHLLPFKIVLVVGALIMLMTFLRCAIREQRIPIFPILNLKHFSTTEKKWYWIGLFMTILGLLCLIIISKYYGYYYFKNGVPTWIKG